MENEKQQAIRDRVALSYGRNFKILTKEAINNALADEIKKENNANKTPLEIKMLVRLKIESVIGPTLDAVLGKESRTDNSLEQVRENLQNFTNEIGQIDERLF